MNIQDAIPPLAWRRRLDDTLENPGKPSRSFTPRIFLQLLPLIVRLWKQGQKEKKAGFDPINLFTPPQPGPIMGVPLGGIGCGSITRGWRGDFCRWALRPGTYSYDIVHADQFSLFVQRDGKPATSQVLNPGLPANAQLSIWKWNMPASCATYHALFPRAWTVYENPLPDLRLVCTQISPVIAGNYQESSYPAAVFHWKIENTGPEKARVGLMFTFQNGNGGANDYAGGHSNETFELNLPGSKIIGIKFHHHNRQKRVKTDQANSDGEYFEDPLTFAIAGLAAKGVEFSHFNCFKTNQDGKDIWDDFNDDGRLKNSSDKYISVEGEAIGAGLAATTTIEGGGSTEVIFSLAWDMPIVRSGYGSAYQRRYSFFFGKSGDAAPMIAAEALTNYRNWEEKIGRWQKPILEDEKLPAWYRTALFNELYYIVDGGTLWAYPLGQKITDAEKDVGHFAYLEGHEYPMFNTYDVHFYASFALLMNWPLLELSLQRDIARATLEEYPGLVKMLFDGRNGRRKIRGMVPHDLGWPHEDFWKKVNGYAVHDVNEWKDLNPKFVLQVYRDWIATGDGRFLRDCWPVVKEAIEKVKRFDVDEDGLIENSGFPDQTYDTWSVKGASAYTGGLWLACLAAAVEMAKKFGEDETAERFCQWLENGKKAYERKLWNGRYYNYDSSHSRQHDSIMADMLAGQWYARACGLKPISKEGHLRQALREIYLCNVQGFKAGRMGAVNGMQPNGKVDRTNMQSQEVWSGTSFALAANLMQEGLMEEAWRTAKGVVNTIFRKGYWFATPEAWDERGNYRSLAYMRPLCIWALQWAWQKLKFKK